MRGRPISSKIRDNVLDILREKQAYGYEIYKKYVKRHGKVHIRSIYYHLKKGVALGLISMEIKEEKGHYSWGNKVERVYYSLR